MIEEAICPECEQGKHGNCNGEALDPVSEQIVQCVCTDPSHTA